MKYKQIPNYVSKKELFKIKIEFLRPTQMCIGLAEIKSREQYFKELSSIERLAHLEKKPVPLILDNENRYWMLDKHHRLRALLQIDRTAKTFGYLVEDLSYKTKIDILDYLNSRGWLYLFNCRGVGPQSKKNLPKNLLELADDPFRSLVWKLKREGLINPQPLIPYNEFIWGNWLRKRPFPPFNSLNLKPAITLARKLVVSKSCSHLPGWKGI